MSLEIDELRAKADEYLDLARRQKAELLNYQERVRREREDWKRQALDDFVRDFLPALDAFTWARFEEPTLMESLRLVEREFHRVLSKHGIVPVETENQAFDPARHEAVAVEERVDVPAGQILEEVRRGWRMSDVVLRPASVRIAKAPPAT
ncbi:MAG TPA: nucleotide exchange factor GrpE [Planctomycetota bacterium]